MDYQHKRICFVLSAFSQWLLGTVASTTTISIQSMDRTDRRQARVTVSLEAICLAAIDDWQFVKISHGLASMCADTLSHVRHGICGLCKCISLECLSRDDQ